MRPFFSRPTALAALVLTLSGAPAAANDSTAALSLGGLTFLHEPDVRMAEEDLVLGLKEVRVRYLFENTSDKDIETLVAFPLPEIATGEAGNYTYGSDDPVNVIGFEVMSDGRKVDAQVQARAESANGVDVTHLLKKYDLPLTTLAGPERYIAMTERLGRLPEADRAELTRHGVVGFWRADDKAEVWEAEPRWVARITFYWLQRFPARSTVEITHRYRPMPRATFFATTDAKDAETLKTFCLDKAFIAAVDARRKSWGDTLSRHDLHYVLTTGNNWQGPIGRFRLTLDKGNPETLVSTCLSGLKKTSPTTFVLEKTAFEPARDIAILFVSKPRTND